MNENNCITVVTMLFIASILAVVLLVIQSIAIDKMKDMTIESGCAEYNSKTSEFEWIIKER